VLLVIVVSLSSCSFLLMVEASCDHKDIICPLPLMNNIIELCVLIMDNIIIKHIHKQWQPVPFSSLRPGNELY